jgi:hypothetical protein
MSLQHYLGLSRASASFREAVNDFLHTGRSNPRLSFDVRSPAVKVERTLTKVLVEYPHLDIESIEIRGHSGCEYFRGELTLRTSGSEQVVAFHWDCRWRAEENGWVDYFGFPDQLRAAREYGWDCFRSWETLAAGGVAAEPELIAG